MKRHIPRFTGFDHCVQDSRQLTHARHESNLFWLARGNQSFVEDLDRRVVTRSRQRCHVRQIPRATAYAKERAPPLVTVESRSIGAMPTSALTSRRDSSPNSGTSAIKVELVGLPAYFALSSKSDKSANFDWMYSAISLAMRACSFVNALTIVFKLSFALEMAEHAEV